MELRIEDRRDPEEWKKEYEESRDRLKKLINEFLEDRPDGTWKDDALNDLKLIEEIDGILKEREEAASKINLSSSDKETFNILYIATLRMYVSQYEIMIEYYDNLPFDLFENKKHMKQIEKLDSLIKRILREELENLQELSPETKYKAFNKAADQAFGTDDDVQKMKRSSQADTFGKHISPEIMQKAKNIAKMMGDGVEVDIAKIDMRDDKDVEMKVRLTFFNEKEDMATSFMITKSKVKREPGLGKHKVIMSEPLPIDEPAMRQIANLIKQIQTKELVDKSVAEDQTFVTADGTKRTLTPDQKKKIQKAKPGETIDITKSGSSMSTVQEGEDEMGDDELKETPETHDLAGKIAEVIDSLKAITEAPKDPKHAKFAEKVMKHMEAAKTALEGLTAHEAVLEEKDAAEQEKAAGKHLSGIRKHLKKVIKDEETLNRIMNKMPVSKAMELKKAAGGELDEEKVAKAMLKYVIKEGLIK